MKTTKTVTITLPIELYEKLLAKAKDENRSFSNLLSNILNYFMNN